MPLFRIIMNSRVYFCAVIARLYSKFDPLECEGGMRIVGCCTAVTGVGESRHACQHYEIEVASLPLSFYRKHDLGGYFLKDRFNDFLRRIQSGKLNTWDFQWMVAVWRKSGLTVTPAVNLIQNIGFGEDATHTATTDGNSRFSVPASKTSIDWERQNPLVVCEQYDKWVVTTWLSASIRAYLWRRVLRVFRSFKK